VQEKYRLPILPPTPAGRYALLLQPLDAAGQPLGPAEALGELTVDNIDRLYDVPMDVARPLLDDASGDTFLRGAMMPTWAAVPGQTTELTSTGRPLIGQHPSTPPSSRPERGRETVLSADHFRRAAERHLGRGQVIEDRAAGPAGRPAARRVSPMTGPLHRRRRPPLAARRHTADYLILPQTFQRGRAVISPNARFARFCSCY
jgi:hypothetical protein